MDEVEKMHKEEKKERDGRSWQEALAGTQLVRMLLKKQAVGVGQLPSVDRDRIFEVFPKSRHWLKPGNSVLGFLINERWCKTGRSHQKFAAKTYYCVFEKRLIGQREDVKAALRQLSVRGMRKGWLWEMLTIFGGVTGSR